MGLCECFALSSYSKTLPACFLQCSSFALSVDLSGADGTGPDEVSAGVLWAVRSSHDHHVITTMGVGKNFFGNVFA